MNVNVNEYIDISYSYIIPFLTQS